MTVDDELPRLRRQMDELNHRLVAVLHERARLCRAIREAKRRGGREALDPAREQAMQDAVSGLAAPDGFPADSLVRIFAAVLAESRRLVGDG
jgi:3-deoxy-7-phosphoheptulonate synthase/chorismate mutase